jgi:hypothetical protein
MVIKALRFAPFGTVQTHDFIGVLKQQLAAIERTRAEGKWLTRQQVANVQDNIRHAPRRRYRSFPCSTAARAYVNGDKSAAFRSIRYRAKLLSVHCKRGLVWGELEFVLPDDKVVRLHGTEWSGLPAAASAPRRRYRSFPCSTAARAYVNGDKSAAFRSYPFQSVIVSAL